MTVLVISMMIVKLSGLVSYGYCDYDYDCCGSCYIQYDYYSNYHGA